MWLHQACLDADQGYRKINCPLLDQQEPLRPDSHDEDYSSNLFDPYSRNTLIELGPSWIYCRCSSSGVAVLACCRCTIEQGLIVNEAIKLHGPMSERSQSSGRPAGFGFPIEGQGMH
jgi:hypothetical protein